MQKQFIQDDEIDLKELFKTLWKRKIFIAIFTLTATLLVAIYSFIKTPIYEATALIEIGEYRLNSSSKSSVDDVNALQKKLSVIFVDMERNNKEKISNISNIAVAKGLKNFLEIRSEAISNDKAKKGIVKVVEFIQTEHKKLLDDVKKQKELELKNIDLQIADIKTKSVALIDKKLDNNREVLENLQNQLKLVDKNLKKIDSLNPSLAALKLMEKRDITNDINKLTNQNFDLESKKEELLTTTLYKLEENKKTAESLLLPHNYKNSQVVGEIMTNSFPVKPKKKLLITVGFITGFIVSIFLVLFLQFIKDENNKPQI